VKYIRLSQEDAKTDSLSIENQRLLLDRYILESDMDDSRVLEFVDNGYSGINFERPGIQELLELVRDGKVCTILVKDFSRFGRNALETGYFIERVFPLYRVRFIAVDDRFDSFELNGDTGGMEVAFKFLIKEYYSRDLSKKISSVRREKALRGEAVTKNCAYGFMLDDNRKMVIDPEAADTVRLIFEMYAENKSLAGIAKRLYRDGRLTPASYKKYKRKTTEEAQFHCVWQKPVILSILRDEQYIGVYVAGKTKTIEIGNPNRADVAEEDWIKILDHHPAIISRELFDAAQEQLRVKGEPLRKRDLNTTKRYGASATSPLRGKVVCGHCGYTMRISCTKNAAFHCSFTLPAPDAECHRLRVLKNELEGVVMDSIKRQAKSVKASGCRVADSLSIPSPAVAEYESQIEKLQDDKQRLYESFVLGDTNQDEYKARKAAIDAEYDRIRKILEAIICQEKANAPDMELIDIAKKALRKRVLSKELVEMLIDKVLVYPDNRIEIVWKLSGFMECLLGKEEPCVAI
jgi:DNA invertase Pin-like site-specific DNA recombinase